MNEQEKAQIDKFLEFAKHRREKQQVAVVSTNQLAQMLGILHAENMETMWYGTRQYSNMLKNIKR